MSQQSQQIAQINDQIRGKLSGSLATILGVFSHGSAALLNIEHSGKRHKVHLTSGTMGSGKLPEVLECVREFSDFSEDNDPYSEHDFGSFVVDGTKYFWKFDYYDTNFEFFAENGQRVLAIMLAEEY